MKQKIIRMAAVLIFFAVSSVLLGTVDEYQRAVQLDGNSVINRYNLGNAYYEEHQYEASVESLKKALEMNKDDKEAHEKVDFKSAQIIGIIDYNFLNNTDDALKYFEIAASINPSDGNISYYTGLAYKKAGNNEKSLQALLKAIKNKADDQPEINFRIGQLYYEKKDYLNAINFFEKAVSLKSDFIEAREYLGDIYDRRGNADKAVENYMSVVRVNPNNLHAQFELGINYSKQKEYDKMILAYKKAISIDPSFADAHYNLGMAYFYRNMYEDAITEFQTAIKLKPEDAAAYSLLAQTKTTAYEYHKSKGSAFLTEDDLLLARDEFVKAMAVKPGDTETQKFLDITNENIKKAVPVRLEKAKNDFDSKKYSDAYSGWDFVLKADPLNNDAKEGMAKIEKNLGELIAAREIKAVQFEKENKLAEAITEYSEIKKIAPKAKKELIDKKISVLMSKIKSSVKSLTAAADEAYAAKLYKKALLKYTEVLKYDERNGKALNGITKINSKIDEDKQKYLDMAKQNRSGNEKKAISYYKKAIELDPNNEEANKGIESLTGKQSSAVLDAQKIRSLYYEGVDKYVNGEVESAIRIWKQVLAMDPNHAEAKKNIKRAEEKLLAIKNLSR